MIAWIAGVVRVQKQGPPSFALQPVILINREELMQQEAGTKKTGSRLLRWWMIVLCLFASWLCWWCVNKLLEPKPLWSSELSDGRYYHPLNESIDGKRLIAAEMCRTNRRGTVRANGVLAVIDSSTGQETHRVQVKEAGWFFSGEVEYLPRFHGNVVCFLSRDNDTGLIRLCRWNLQTGKLDEEVKTWKHAPFSPQVFWPIKSKVLVVRYHIHPDFFSLASAWPDPFKASIVQILCNMGLLHMPCWFESYQLPEHAGEPLRFLARWVPPAGYWFNSPALSPDGQWAVFSDAGGDESLAYQRALATGHTEFRSLELFQLFRPEQQGLLAYSTATGCRSHRLHDPAIQYSHINWRGSALILHKIQADEKIHLSMAEIREGARDRNQNLFSRTFRGSPEVYQVDQNGFHSVRLPSQFEPFSVNLYYHGTMINALQKFEHQHVFHELNLDRGELAISRSFSIDPKERTERWLQWMPGTDQYLSLQGSLHHRIHLHLAGKWPWLDTVLNWIDPFLSKEGHLVVIEERDGWTRECSFQQVIFDDWNVQFSRLYLLESTSSGDAPTTKRLNAYQVPIKIPSAWWSRLAAFAPVVLLVIYWARRKFLPVAIQSP
ncbi:MAG: hypothetical protein QM703_12670 [Gemmatales bacterium]